MLNGILFDADGTLFDTEGMHFQAWADVLKKYGASLSRKEYLKYAGKSGPDIELALISAYGLDAMEGDIMSKKRELVRQRFAASPVPLMPYAEEAVRFFHLHAMKLAAVSGSSQEELDLKMSMSHLSDFFTCKIAVSGRIRGKPHPDLYRKALEILDLKSGQCIAFEDTRTGVQAAKAANLFTIAVPNEFTKGQDFSNADKVFGSMEEAVAFVRHENLL